MTQPDSLTQSFIRRHGNDCSYIPVRWWQVLWYLAASLILCVALLYRWDIVFCLVNFILAFWYFSIILFRVFIVTLSSLGYGQIRVSDEELEMLSDEALPVYTILVPLYKEANVADKIVRSIHNLDYPRKKLDVKILLEEDDLATIRAVKLANLDDHYEVIIVPNSFPKTKPKACNHGLARAKGKYCVIFDAEDRPESDQLKKVVAAFDKMPDEVACLQARLNYYNANQNLLTKWFTIEYSTTFDLYLPGLQSAHVPIPLGGTSNHFRTKILESLEGWDPFNVTEDCDLGIRLYRAGFTTRMVDSTTWEEANSRLWNWIRQRSRWVKGFFQTHITHMRNPFRTFRELGPWGFLGFILCVGGSSTMMILNIFYWLISAVYIGLVAKAVAQGHQVWEILSGPREWLSGNIVWPMIYYGPKEDAVWSTLSVVFFVIACVLFLANLLFIFMHCLACFKRRFYELLPYALLMPFYWILISLGAWKGFLQLFTNPFYWEKTDHGLDHGEA